MEIQGTQNSKITLKKKNIVGGITLPHFQTYSKAAVTKMLFY